MNGQKLHPVTRFKYLCSVTFKDPLHPSSCMLVTQGPSQQSSKGEYKPWKWGSTARYYATHTITTLPHEDLLTIVKRRKLKWYGHVSCSSCLAKTILQGTVKAWKNTRQTEKDKEMGRQHQGVDRPGVRQVPGGSGEQRKIEESGCEVICSVPTTLVVKG